MSATDRRALIQWREALLWVAKAEADIAGAALREPPGPNEKAIGG
jgi:hypothetical protein